MDALSVCIIRQGEACLNMDCKEGHITGVVKKNDDQIIISTRGAPYSLIEQNYDKDGCLKLQSCKLSIFSNIDIQFIGAIGPAEGYGVIKKDSFDILFFKDRNCNYTNLKIDGCGDFKDKLLSLVKAPQCDSCQTPCSCKKECKCKRHCKCKKTHNKCKCRKGCKCDLECKCKIPCSCDNKYGCSCATCYKLVGFFMRGSEIFFAISATCSKNSKSRYLYLVRSYLNQHTLEINNKLELFAIYNLYAIARNNHISKCKAKKLRATGFSYKNGELYILTNYGKGGYLWTVDMCGCTSKLKLRCCKGNILEINKYPIGITHLDNDMLFIIGDACHGKKFNYHVAHIPYRPKKCIVNVNKELTYF